MFKKQTFCWSVQPRGTTALFSSNTALSCRCGRETQLKETGLIVLDADLPARSYDCAAAHLHAFGSKRPSHPPGVKADHKHDIDRHAKNNVKDRHEEHGFLQYQCL